jgi:hypothetical protein
MGTIGFTKILCSKCGMELDVVGHKTSSRVVVEPCKRCLSKHFDEAFQKGFTACTDAWLDMNCTKDCSNREG